MDILFLLCLLALFVLQLVMYISSLRKNKRNLFIATILVEISSIAIAAGVLYCFNEVLFKYAPNFEGFFQSAGVVLFVMIYSIMFVVTSIVWLVKNVKNKIV